jgi:hypothetical protein
MTVFVRSENDGTVVAAAGIFLAVGFILTALTLLAGFAVFKENPKLLSLYLCLIWIVLVLGLICGFMCVGFSYDIHRFVKKGMLAQLQNQYSWDGRIGMAWNRVQVKKRCCGVDGSWDYLESAWYADTNSADLVQKTAFVPTSCCVLNFNQDRELYWVDPQNLQPKDETRCNEDAEGNKDPSANLHTTGCFSALFTKNRDVMHDQHIYTILDVIAGLGLTAGFLQIFAIILAFVYRQALRQGEARIDKATMGRY